MLQKIQVTTQANTRAGDALHLSVALQCEAKAFVTLDNAQAASAKQLGFEVVTI
jgi:predicted nucleic acid-binding protein